ncbi:MAG: hypothetical protein LWW85_05310 [Marinilabiliales bacterium]|nr:hypothetical protein [Marinilabiliales bacterium]
MGSKSEPGSIFYNSSARKKEIEDNLKELLEDQKNNKKIPSEKEFTLKQQILIMHYFGILKLFKDLPKTKSAKIIACMLNRSEKNVKDAITYVGGKVAENDVHSIANLEAILPIFDNELHKEIIEHINQDLLKLDNQYQFKKM